MDLLKLLKDESLLCGNAATQAALAELISAVADTNYEGMHVVTGHNRTCLAFFPDDFDQPEFIPERKLTSCDVDGLALFCERQMDLVYDPPQNPSPDDMMSGWEVRSAEINHDTVVFVLTTWILDKP
mgnify:CR=1 FL=1